MFHVELRKGAKALWRYNLSEGELLLKILEPWVTGRWFELGEHEWNARESQIKILEAPELPIGQLTMGRGWSVVQRKGVDVTERMLELARARVGESSGLIGDGLLAGPQAPGRAGLQPTSVPMQRALVDSLGLQLLAELGDETRELSLAWSLAATRDPSLEPAESLGLAQEVVGSLLASGLLSVSLEDAGAPIERKAAEALLRDPSSWGMGEGRARVVIRRS